MKNNNWIFLLCIVLASCCKGKKDDKYTPMKADDREWFMTGNKQVPIYQDSATGKRDTLVYGDIETKPTNCNTINKGSWLFPCNSSTCGEFGYQKLISFKVDTLKRLAEIIYTDGVFYGFAVNKNRPINEHSNLTNAKVNGNLKNGYFLNFPESVFPEPYQLFINETEGVLTYKYKDKMGHYYRWDKVNQ